MDIPYDGRKHPNSYVTLYRPPHTTQHSSPAAGYHPGLGGQPHEGHPPRPEYATGCSNKHPEALEFNYVYRGGNAPEKNTINLIMTGLYIVSVCLFFLYLIAAMTLNPITPIYHLNYVSVANFSTVPTLTGDWYTNITVYNPNSKQFGYFQDFKLDVLHNNEIIARASSAGFELDKNKHTFLEVKASTNSAIVNALKNPKLQLGEIKNEQDSKLVLVDIRIAPVSVFMSKITSYKEGMAMAYCTGLKIKLENDNSTTTNGSLDSGGQPNFCRIIIMKEGE